MIDRPPPPAAPKSDHRSDRPCHPKWLVRPKLSAEIGAGNHHRRRPQNSAQVSKSQRPRIPTPPPGLRPAAVALRAAQNSGLAFSSDRRAPDPLRQSADGCALSSRLETRYLRLPSPLRHNIFRQTRAPFGPHSDEDLRWRPDAPQACHFASVIGNNLSIGTPQAASAWPSAVPRSRREPNRCRSGTGRPSTGKCRGGAVQRWGGGWS